MHSCSSIVSNFDSLLFLRLADWMLSYSSGETGRGLLLGTHSIGGIMLHDLLRKQVQNQLQLPRNRYQLHLLARSLFGTPSLLRGPVVLSILNETQYEILFRCEKKSLKFRNCWIWICNISFEPGFTTSLKCNGSFEIMTFYLMKGAHERDSNWAVCRRNRLRMQTRHVHDDRNKVHQ